MAKVGNPVTLAEHLDLDPKVLDERGVTNITLALDTKLFVDPMLIASSSHRSFAAAAVLQYSTHFEKAIKLLAAVKSPGDVAWRSAHRLFEFHEIRGTCLGYGADSIDGSAWGNVLIERVLGTAREIVDLGIQDPGLFPLLGLLEEDVGPDRISDMTTNVIIDALLAFNVDVLISLGLTGEAFDVLGRSSMLLINPFHPKRTPIILVPHDILRPLPLATDWDDVAVVADHNDTLRDQVNAHIGHIWAAKAKRHKRELRDQALSSKQAFETLLSVLRTADKRAYNVVDDPDGLVQWAPRGHQIAEKYPIEIAKPEKLDLEAAHKIVRIITEQFRQLVEHNGQAKSLWYGEEALPEKYVQRLFFAIAYSYCKANNLDLSPEVDSGNGQVDFKMSKGFDARVLVEIKLSSNPKLVSGFTNQLEAYKASEETMRAIYLVVDVGRMGRKDEKLIKLRNEATKAGDPVSDLDFVDGHIKSSASML